MLPKDWIFQNFEHKYPLSIGQRVSFLNFEQFLYIKCGLLKFGLMGKRKKIKKEYKNMEFFKFQNTNPFSIGQHVSLLKFWTFFKYKIWII